MGLSELSLYSQQYQSVFISRTSILTSIKSATFERSKEYPPADAPITKSGCRQAAPKTPEIPPKK